ncbi:MAG: hypothetical protein KKF44_08845, partial [Nanoarchaeota archaeon]|nr:hypothetical protein [Nanoarchaeota archaeon]
GGGGGGGRIAVYFNNYTYDGNISAYGAWGYGSLYGGAGTIYLNDTQNSNFTLTIDNNNYDGEETRLLANLSLYDDDNNSLIIKNKGYFEIPDGNELYINYSHFDITTGYLKIIGNFTAPNLRTLNITSTVGKLIYQKSLYFLNVTLTTTGTLESGTNSELILKNLIVKPGGAYTHSNTYRINLSIANITIESGGSIDVNAKGSAGGSGNPGTGDGIGGGSGSNGVNTKSGSGAGYGGEGSNGYNGLGGGGAFG